MELWGCVRIQSFINSKAFSFPRKIINHDYRLYYEFVNYSTIGFGDMIPTDEATVGGGSDFLNATNRQIQ